MGDAALALAVLRLCLSLWEGVYWWGVREHSGKEAKAGKEIVVRYGTDCERE